MEKANLLTELKSRRISRPSLFLMTGKRPLVVAISSMGWKNFIRALSEASPMVGISSHSMLFTFSYHSATYSFNFCSFSLASRCLSSRMRSCSASGGEGSKTATEHTMAQSCRARKPGSLGSYSKLKEGSSFCLLLAFSTLPEYIKWAAIILFMVSVPVLSEQIQVVQPSVSTACSFFASTFFLERRLAVRVRDIVTYSKRPLGTFATVMPMASVRALIGWKPIPRPTDSTMMPRLTAAIPRRCTNLLISWLSGVSSSSAPIARPAICPMKVLSPVKITTPLPDPSRLSVEKKAMFRVSRGLSGLEHQTVLERSSVQPVREELSTFIPLDSTMRISAGIFLPSYTLMRSPRTNFKEEMDFSTPSRITVISGGMKFLKLSIMALLLRFCANSTKVEMLRMATITMPRQRLLGSQEARAKAMKQSMAPAHISMAKKLAMWCRYSTKGFIPSFSLSLFSPSLSNLSYAAASVSPFFKSVPYLFTNSSSGMRWSSMSLNFSASPMDLFIGFPFSSVYS